MAVTNLSINTDSELKEKAQIIFNELGFDISTAVNMFLKQAVFQEGLPFEVTLNRKAHDYNPQYILEPDVSKLPVFGRMRDSIEIPSDFDEPLDEMKEYMQ